MLKVSGLVSTKSTWAPQYRAQLAEATKVFERGPEMVAGAKPRRPGRQYGGPRSRCLPRSAWFAPTLSATAFSTGRHSSDLCGQEVRIHDLQNGIQVSLRYVLATIGDHSKLPYQRGIGVNPGRQSVFLHPL